MVYGLAAWKLDTLPNDIIEYIYKHLIVNGGNVAASNPN